MKLNVWPTMICDARTASVTVRIEISPTSFCSATKSLSSGGVTVRTACGSTTSRVVWRWLSPSDRAAATWLGCTDSMPARNTSATYAE